MPSQDSSQSPRARAGHVRIAPQSSTQSLAAAVLIDSFLLVPKVTLGLGAPQTLRHHQNPPPRQDSSQSPRAPGQDRSQRAGAQDSTPHPKPRGSTQSLAAVVLIDSFLLESDVRTGRAPNPAPPPNLRHVRIAARAHGLEQEPCQDSTPELGAAPNPWQLLS